VEVEAIFKYFKCCHHHTLQLAQILYLAKTLKMVYKQTYRKPTGNFIMAQLLNNLDQAIQVLDNNDFLFLPTETSYILTHRHKDYIRSYRNHITKPVFLFSDVHYIQDYTGHLTWFAQYLLQVLPPGAVEFIIPGNGKLNESSFTIYIPADKQTQAILERYQQPLCGVYPQFGFNALITSSHQLDEYSQFKESYILDSKETSKNNGLLPTLIDLTKPDKVVIRRPGPISYEEINSALAGRIPVTKEYQEPKKYHDNVFKIETAKQIDKTATGTTLLMGSRENLSRFFPIGSNEYFQLKKFGNYVAMNLGSTTNSEMIAKNLSRNFLEIHKLGIEKVIFLEQNWGSHKWAEAIKHYLRSVLPTTTQTEPLPSRLTQPAPATNQIPTRQSGISVTA
jgi:tRNA A37 threonylcarbamoyladenosine synthetase subunit TsaC/SUA5/YrdC